ncbi:MAG: isochorismatase family protein [Tepidimonas sp.]|uniref:isochorismatase family protein n=1 Tax=Tepidimonas sp. TaxID=2002775 RepID=UPI00259F5896|nr:isochorismatase family protein [Tepidimonas sp.]MDM7456359.1 isochorismatase family protein [Tepidimonas sp.]
MLLDANDCQLVLVDYQARLMPAIARGGEVLQRAELLAGLAHLLDVPVWGTEQAPQRLGALAQTLRNRCRQVFAKTTFDACDSGLLTVLRAPTRSAGNARSLPKHLQKPPAPARQTIVLAGCEAHVCLLQTALGLAEQELDVWVVTDACGSRRDRDRDAAFDRLAANGVELVTAEMVGFEWLRDAQHPRFREALALLK